MAEKIENLLETSSIFNAISLTGNITGVAGASAIVGVGTLFTTELQTGDIIGVLDDAGNIQYYTIDTITDNLNAAIVGTFRTNITANAPSRMWLECGYFIQNDPKTSAIIGKDRVYANEQLVGPSRSIVKGILISANNYQLFDSNEGILIKSIYVRLPYQYTFADQGIKVTFYYVDNLLGTRTVIQNIGENGVFYFPIENTEIPVNTYIPSPQSLGTPIYPGESRWALAAEISGAVNQDSSFTVAPGNDTDLTWVSSLNAPSEMDGTLLPIVIGARVLYGLNMSI
jgi:hypothetical protein